jgi:hypothetical protein
MAIVHPGGFRDVAPDAPADREGNPPFAIPGDFSTAGTTSASRRYWEWIDTIVAKAAARNMVVMLAYTYLGFDGGDMGWYREILGQPTRQALHDWGLWLGKRFAGADNVIWFALGDHAPPEGSEGALRARAIAEGIRAGGARQLFMAEGPPPDSIPTEHGDFSDVLDQSSFYGYGPEGSGTVYETADRAWRQSAARPAWMQEGTYEHENNWGRFSGQPWDTRRGRYWSVLAGGTAGDGFGSRSVWQWIDIPESLSSAGAEYSSHAFELFRSIRWWELRPSGTDPGFAGLELVCSGQGSWGRPDYITSALTARSDWMLAYVPVTRQGSRAFSVTMSALSARVRARWFDPATGTYLAISEGYSLRNDGTWTFTTPGARKDGTDDWVLILDSTGDARCGWVTRDGLYHAPTRFDPDVTCRITVSQTSDLAIVAEAPITPASN